MPIMFQTGERPPRPLYPDTIYYTSVQKVADMLQIPFPDPVDLTADSNTSATSLKISPADYRLVGFEVGDDIELASDVELGETVEITTIARDGTDVIISWSGGVSGDYDIADNATVQNLQSFTNGKRRGVTKAAVETLIKRTQDKIDNLTNNAWRPMLQTAEYLNFDTYKPYRRRYYTDYVGTVPLKFRNIQQILRLEIWQGQDYREVAAAEARLQVLDHSVLTTADYVYLCPGGGGVASLRIGSATNQWRADFDKSSTAQQLADLINKDTRRNKAGLAFSPSFTLESVYETGGSATANVHHEFIASANADYGAAKLKITSMSRGEGGQEATIATTNLTGLSCSGLTDNDTTSTADMSGGTTLNVVDAGPFAEYGILYTGSGVSVKAAYYTAKTATSFTGVVDLTPTGFIAAVNASDIAINQYKFKIDYVGSTTGDEARLRDWWCDYEMGIVYFNNTYPYFEWNSVKATYVYGERYVEKAIEDIATKLVAMDLLISDDRSVLLPEGTQNIDLGSKYQLLKQQVAETLPRYVEVMTLD
jgi:hypothetical protein